MLPAVARSKQECSLPPHSTARLLAARARPRRCRSGHGDHAPSATTRAAETEDPPSPFARTSPHRPPDPRANRPSQFPVSCRGRLGVASRRTVARYRRAELHVQLRSHNEFKAEQGKQNKERNAPTLALRLLVPDEPRSPLRRAWSLASSGFLSEDKENPGGEWPA